MTTSGRVHQGYCTAVALSLRSEKMPESLNSWPREISTSSYVQNVPESLRTSKTSSSLGGKAEALEQVEESDDSDVFDVKSILDFGLDEHNNLMFDVEWEHGDPTQELWIDVKGCDDALRAFFSIPERQSALRHMLGNDFSTVYNADANVDVEMLKEFILPEIWEVDQQGFVYENGKLWPIKVVQILEEPIEDVRQRVVKAHFYGFDKRFDRKVSAWKLLREYDVENGEQLLETSQRKELSKKKATLKVPQVNTKRILENTSVDVHEESSGETSDFSKQEKTISSRKSRRRDPQETRSLPVERKAKRLREVEKGSSLQRESMNSESGNLNGTGIEPADDSFEYRKISVVALKKIFDSVKELHEKSGALLSEIDRLCSS